MRTPRSRRLSSLLCATAMLLNACSTWRIQTAPVTAVVTGRAPGQVRVERANGASQVLTRPTLVGDSVRGREGSVAVSEITRLYVRRADPVASIALVGAAAFVLVGVAFALAGPHWNLAMGWRSTPR